MKVPFLGSKRKASRTGSTNSAVSGGGSSESVVPAELPSGSSSEANTSVTSPGSGGEGDGSGGRRPSALSRVFRVKKRPKAGSLTKTPSSEGGSSAEKPKGGLARRPSVDAQLSAKLPGGGSAGKIDTSPPPTTTTTTEPDPPPPPALPTICRQT